MAAGRPHARSVLRALTDANVQFVVVGEPAPGAPLHLVVSRHPTNLDALGRALGGLDATLRNDASAVAGAVPGPPGESEDAGPRRVGDPAGTIPVATSMGDVDLMFGGPRRSLYAEAVTRAQVRAIEGVRVQWTATLPTPEPAPRVTSRILGRRLLSLAEGLLHQERDTGRTVETGGAAGEDPVGEDGQEAPDADV